MVFYSEFVTEDEKPEWGTSVYETKIVIGSSSVLEMRKITLK